jgi:signal transduction histidine kinase
LLARTDAGVLKMNREPVNMMQVIEDALDQASVLAGAKSVTLNLGTMEHVQVMGDFMHLGRLVFNLVDNAIKYAPAHGMVTVSLEQSGADAALSVKDTGVGIAADEQQKVFQRFYRSAEARSGQQGGSGLGLSIVKSIAEAHGGRITLESEPGKGTTFTVFLPVST